MSIPKVSIDHQGLQETITHMDGDDGTEEKTERNTQFMYTPSRTATHQPTQSARGRWKPLG